MDDLFDLLTYIYLGLTFIGSFGVSVWACFLDGDYKEDK